MRALICYDVADDLRRQRLVHVLLDYGQRVQESVFWIETEDDLDKRIRERVGRVIEGKEDSVWIVVICAACAPKIETLGPNRVPASPEFYVL
jgi:CRISPR-associated protein Cas2